MGTASDLDRIAQLAPRGGRLATRPIEGADHLYGGYEEAVAGVIADWLDDLRPPPAGPPRPVR